LAARPPSHSETLLAPWRMEAANASSFTLYSEPINLRYGQVHTYRASDGQRAGWRLPADVIARYADGSRQMAIRAYEFDFVRRHPDGTETAVPEYELYDHHHYVQFYNRRNQPLTQFGASFEYRGTQFAYRAPYRTLLHRPTTWYPFLHLINVRKVRFTEPGHSRAVPFDGEPSPLMQCPCTPQRIMDLENSTIDGVVSNVFNCPPWLAGNPACSLATYVGGARCCYHNQFVFDTTQCVRPGCAEYPVDRAYFRVTFHYEDAVAATRPIRELTCCSLTSHGFEGPADNVEFDIVPCEAGTPPGACVRRFEAVMPLDTVVARAEDGPNVADRTRSNGSVFELAYALPHLHEGGLAIEMQDALTNRTVCHASREDGGVVYGTGTAAGNERGYITGFRTCTWGETDAPRFGRSHPMRLIAHYDARRYITGAMARMVVVGHEVGAVADDTLSKDMGMHWMP